MRTTKTTPYGSWKSPITSELIVAQSTTLSEVRIDGGAIYWLEGRPQEQGRSVVVRAGATEQATDVIPKPFNVRTRVHEYGGGSWTVADGTIYFSNFGDGRLYRLVDGASDPEPLTPEPPASDRQWRFADGTIDRQRRNWIGIREDHTGGGEPINAIVAVNLRDVSREPGTILVEGHDFFVSPRLSPDGRHMLWLAWDHPNMPWNGTTLYLAELDAQGRAIEPRIIAGGVAESVFQPEWSPDGQSIVFVSDRSNWWNLYRFDLTTRTTEPLTPMDAEFGVPQWNLSAATYAYAGAGRMVCAYSKAGIGHLAVLDLARNTLRPLELPFTEFGSVRADGQCVVFRAAASDQPNTIVTLNLDSGEQRTLRKSTGLLDQPGLRIADYLTKVMPVEFPTENGKTAFGLFYPPHNPDCAADSNEKPPLLVKCHGGPTSSASSALNLGIQYWTSRGIAVLDVNYGGSTGFGRDYRERLHLNWGIVDVEDCINGAKYLAQQNVVDERRAVISGGQRGRLYYAGGAGVPRLLPGWRKLLRRERHRGAWRVTPTSSSRAISTG